MPAKGPTGERPAGALFAAEMKLVVNGQPHEHGGDGSLPALLRELGAEPERVAVVINEQVVPRSEWAEKRVQSGDRVEVFTFMGGG